ncbi:MAG: hypothetical protein ACPL7J_09920, partial [Desulfomonilaceae bacterium]
MDSLLRGNDMQRDKSAIRDYFQAAIINHPAYTALQRGILLAAIPRPMSGDITAVAVGTTAWRIGYQSVANGDFPLVAEGLCGPMATPSSLPRPTALLCSIAA